MSSETLDFGQLLIQQRQAALQKSFAIQIDRQAQLAIAKLRGEAGWRQKILFKILELAGALDPDVPRAKAISQLRQHTELVKPSIDSLITLDKAFPALPNETGRRILRYLSRLALIHASKSLHAGDDGLSSRRCFKRERLQQNGRIPAELGESVTDQGQIVELHRLSQLFRLGNALTESVPGQHSLDGCVRIAAALLRIQQDTADS